jgi:hypothetical protein
MKPKASKAEILAAFEKISPPQFESVLALLIIGARGQCAA